MNRTLQGDSVVDEYGVAASLLPLSTAKNEYGSHSICIYMHSRSSGVEESTILGEYIFSRCSNSKLEIAAEHLFIAIHGSS